MGPTPERDAIKGATMMATRRSPLAALRPWLFAACLLLLGAVPAPAADPVRFSLADAPGARAVFLAGEFNGWNVTATPLRRDGAGTWSVEVPLPPGRHAYKFVVDGRWREDPAATETAEDGLGGRNSVRVVGGEGGGDNFGTTTLVGAPPSLPSLRLPSAPAALPAPSASTPPPPPPAVGRWTTESGQAFTAEFLRLGGNNVALFLLNGREYLYPLHRLVPADQRRVREILQARQPAAANPPGTPVAAGTPAGGGPTVTTFAGQPLVPGEGLVVNVPLGTDPRVLQPIREAYGKPSTSARMFLAVPRDFAPTPARPYPVLIVSSTTDGEATSVGAAGGYVPAATDKGFVVLALDGEFAKPALAHHDSQAFRWALVQAGLNALAAEWPASKTWPVATGGVSGGGGYASHQAILLAVERRERPLLGIFLAVSNWNPTDFEADLRRAPFVPFRQVPIFMSVGENDQIATPAHTEGARAEMLRGGFKRLRFERFPGGHELWGEHLRAALDWFLESGRQANPPLDLRQK